MALVDELLQQVLHQTRVVTNAPNLAAGEPLRVDVVPGGLPLADVVSATSPLLADLSLTVSYKLERGSEDITSKTPRTPMPAGADATELLSVAFLIPPLLWPRQASLPPLGVPPLGLLPPDGKLTVTLTVRAGAQSGTPQATRDIAIPFTFPQIDLPVIPPALCLLSPDKNLEGRYSVLLVAPGSGGDAAQAIGTFNQIVVLLGQLAGLVQGVGALVAPLRRVLTALSATPAPQMSNAALVDLNDFVEYADLIDTGLDDIMSSYIAVGPTGTVLRLSDDDYDNHRKVTLIDVLDLPNSADGQFLIGQLGITDNDVTQAAASLKDLLGGATQLGIGVALCLDLGDDSIPGAAVYRTYESGDSMENDLGYVTWSLPPTL
jgi:hypothetical protein